VLNFRHAELATGFDTNCSLEQGNQMYLGGLSPLRKALAEARKLKSSFPPTTCRFTFDQKLMMDTKFDFETLSCVVV